MKKLFILLCILVVAPCFAFETDGGNIKSVSLYQNSALISREFKANLAKGENSIVIKGLSSLIDVSTFRITPKNAQGLRISEINTEETFLSGRMQEKLAQLTDKLETTDKQIRQLTDEAAVLRNSVDFIKRSSPFSINQKTSIAEMGEYLKFAELTLSIKNSKIAETESAVKLLKIRKDALEKEIAFIKGGNEEAFNLIITLTSASDKTADFELSYVTGGAGWEPVFEMRADSSASKAEISAYAGISQTTGEDWKNVTLEISTLSPETASVPEVSPWYIDIYKPSHVSSDYGFMPKAMAMPVMEVAEKSAMPEEPRQKEGLNSFSFALPDRISIPSDGQNHRILLKTAAAETEFELYSVPKQSKKAFLTATVKNPFSFPIISGEMNVFLDDSLVNTEIINPSVPSGEEIAVSFGVDESVKVERKLAEKKTSEKGVFSKDESVSYAYEITVINAKKKAVNITIDEAVPVSRNEQIKVTMGKYTAENAEIDEEGILSWTLKLNPMEKKVLKLGYTVEYPSDANVTGLE